jgi:hypothetical protein
VLVWALAGVLPATTPKRSNAVQERFLIVARQLLGDVRRLRENRLFVGVILKSKLGVGQRQGVARRTTMQLNLYQHLDELARAIASRPNGAQAVSHVRGNRRKMTDCRYDFIYVSSDVRVHRAVALKFWPDEECIALTAALRSIVKAMLF